MRDPETLVGAWRLGRGPEMGRPPGLSHLAFAMKPFRPFGCAAWSPALKLARMAEHVALVHALGGILLPRPGGPRPLADLSAIAPGLWVAIDEPVEMLQDGLCVLSLMEGQVRIFQVSFTLVPMGQQASGRLQVFVGGIQGRLGELDHYRDLTKACHGMRPRDLVVEAFRQFCRALGVQRISAVADDSTYHHDRYFGAHPYRPVRMDYDAIWHDRGGKRVDRDWFDLPLTTHRRLLEDIPARKRALYRRRYAMLDDLQTIMADAVRLAVPAVGIGPQAGTPSLIAVSCRNLAALPAIAACLL